MVSTVANVASLRLFRRAIAAIVLILAILVATVPHASAERRVALVIGNDIYTHLPNLNNARKDAEGMAAKLRGLGFETILKVNAGRREMHRALRQFENRLTDGAVGLAFFAGHGIQADGTNFLVPADANIQEEDDLRSEALTAQHILTAMERASNPLNIVILDACRDNPLPNRSRSARRGLTVVGIPAGVKGTAILYSAGEGQTAEDGPPGGHGVFTGELLKVMDQPGLSLEQVFKRVNRRVQQSTNNRQRPWSLMSLQGDFVFRNANQPSASIAMAPTPAANASNDPLFWKSIKDSEDPYLFRAYLEQFPGGVFAVIARSKLAKISSAQKTTSSKPQMPNKDPLDTFVFRVDGRSQILSINRRDGNSFTKSLIDETGVWVSISGEFGDDFLILRPEIIFNNSHHYLLEKSIHVKYSDIPKKLTKIFYSNYNNLNKKKYTLDISRR